MPEKKLWIGAAILTTLVAFFSEGFHHFDEHFQIIEFMNFKLGNVVAKDLPWEYHKQLRPWFQPYLYMVLDFPFRSIGASPFFRAFILRLLSGLFALLSCYYFSRKVLKPTFKEKSQNALILLLFTWFIPYINIRASSEGLSLSFFFLGLSLVVFEKKYSNVFLGALLFGLSYLTRFQMGLPVAVIWFWGIYRKWQWQKLLIFALAILLIFGLGFAIDSTGYGEKTFPLWNYFKFNFLEGVLDQMGTSPWYKYMEWAVIKAIPPISLVLVIGTLLFWKKNFLGEYSWLTWVTVSFFLFHTMIGHKELRFIFLIGYLSPLMAYKAFNRMPPNWLWAINIILILATLKPANRMLPLYKFLYYSPIQTLHYIEEDPTKLVGLPLNFYLKKNLSILPLKEESAEGKFVFTKRFPATSQYLEKSNCKPLYLNYPEFIFNLELSKKVLKKSKAMGVFKCT
ncbi:MAG: hypothetical protein NXH75_08780 [Halobacteriovoraceae bacterium]|nr:hypothetical protein [Halobacteriovoraceae bacterium]